MASEKAQPKSHDPADEALPNLSESDVEELVRFFQLLDEWDRQEDG